MKEQEFLSGEAMRAHFDSARAESRQDLDDTGAAKILHDLSQSISQLQANGVDVRMTMRSEGHSNAYDLMYTTSGGSGGTIKAHGFIETGKTCHLWAIATHHAGNAVARLYLSKYNAGSEGGRTTSDFGKTTEHTAIPGYCFDYNEDTEALKKFQEQIIEICANNAAILENDTGNVFNTTPAPVIQKTAPKLKL